MALLVEYKCEQTTPSI